MATFYVLPSRECLEQAVAEFCRRTLPGVVVPESLWPDLAELIAAGCPDQYLVHREDLPPSADPLDELVAGFGAESGDVVVEIGATAGRMSGVRRTVGPAVVPVSASAP